jgi:hypothetical protein
MPGEGGTTGKILKKNEDRCSLQREALGHSVFHADSESVTLSVIKITYLSETCSVSYKNVLCTGSAMVGAVEKCLTNEFSWVMTRLRADSSQGYGMSISEVWIEITQIPHQVGFKDRESIESSGGSGLHPQEKSKEQQLWTTLYSIRKRQFSTFEWYMSSRDWRLFRITSEHRSTVKSTEKRALRVASHD